MTALDATLIATLALAAATVAAWVAELLEVTPRRLTTALAIGTGAAATLAAQLVAVGERTSIDWWAIAFYAACAAVPALWAFVMLAVWVDDAAEREDARRMGER